MFCVQLSLSMTSVKFIQTAVAFVYLLHVSVVCPFLLLSSIPLNGYALIDILIHLMLNMRVISREGLL